MAQCTLVLFWSTIFFFVLHTAHAQYVPDPACLKSCVPANHTLIKVHMTSTCFASLPPPSPPSPSSNFCLKKTEDPPCYRPASCELPSPFITLHHPSPLHPSYLHIKICPATDKLWNSTFTVAAGLGYAFTGPCYWACTMAAQYVGECGTSFTLHPHKSVSTCHPSSFTLLHLFRCCMEYVGECGTC